MANDPNDGYKVGNGHPPRDAQFKPGVSGNPRGRPKGSRNLASIIRKVAGERIQITKNGKKATISVGEALIRQLVKLALPENNLKALIAAVNLVGANEDVVLAVGVSPEENEKQRRWLRNYVTRFAEAEQEDSSNVIS